MRGRLVITVTTLLALVMASTVFAGEDVGKSEVDRIRAAQLEVVLEREAKEQAKQASYSQYYVAKGQFDKEYFKIIADAMKNEQAIRETLFQNQLNYHGPIFGIVILIVLCGVGLTIYQMIVASSIKPVTNHPTTVAEQPGAAQIPAVGQPNPLPGPALDASMTEIELSTSSLKVKTQLVGLAILAMSLAFFYLYLVYVYKIVGEQQQSDAAQSLPVSGSETAAKPASAMPTAPGEP